MAKGFWKELPNMMNWLNRLNNPRRRMALNGIKRLCIIAILPRNNEWYKEVSCHLNITKSFCSPFQPQKYGLDIPQCLFFMPGLHCHFPSITKLHCYKLFDRVRWPILFENFIEGLKPLSWLSWRALIIELIHSASSSIENLHMLCAEQIIKSLLIKKNVDKKNRPMFLPVPITH